ncbi:G-protein alpha subunit [Plasmodiophora brassicae]
MSCCAGTVAPDVDECTDLIDRQLRVERLAAAKMPVALFLGIGESGKSTFYKQLRLLHGVQFELPELVQFRDSVHTMIINDVCRLVTAASDVSVVSKIKEPVLPMHPSTEEAKYFVSQWLFGSKPSVVTDEIANTVYTLWTDPAIQQVYKYRNEFHLGSHAQHFLDKIATIAKPSWLPTETDIVRLRNRTTGIQDQRITMNGSVIRIVDVGGQRSERRKWISQFSSATAIMYVVALSEYNQLCSEDNRSPRMAESLRVFEEVCSAPLLVKAGIVVFFNKCDQFREKLEVVPFKHYAVDYEGDGSYESACQYMMAQYKNTAERVFQAMSLQPRVVHFYFTTAIDKDNVAKVFSSVHSILLSNKLANHGMV